MLDRSFVAMNRALVRAPHTAAPTAPTAPIGGLAPAPAHQGRGGGALALLDRIELHDAALRRDIVEPDFEPIDPDIYDPEWDMEPDDPSISSAMDDEDDDTEARANGDDEEDDDEMRARADGDDAEDDDTEEERDVDITIVDIDEEIEVDDDPENYQIPEVPA